jgi:hypothetical protein
MALSTNETNAVSEGAKELVWLKCQLSELLSDFAKKAAILYIDNVSAIKLTKNPRASQKVKTH